MNKSKASSSKTTPGFNWLVKCLIALVFALIVGTVLYLPLAPDQVPVSGITPAKPHIALISPQLSINQCANNLLSQLIIVSISQRHTWACAYTQTLLSTPVITGNENLASDLTPTGTYHILSKHTDVYLIGCDTDQPNVCWKDYVNYWMPFLFNSYGAYGMHDATWRSPSDFGNISPDTSNASHGCIETPLTAMTWLFNWASVGTTIEIIS